MSNWNKATLQLELQHATGCGWMPYFQATAHELKIPCEILLAIASRETGIQDVRGDLRNGTYHGFGVMQVDVGTDPDFCCAWTPGKVQESIDRAGAILAEKRSYLAKKKVTDWKAIAAAYNAGQGKVFELIKAGKNPDLVTNRGNYGSDVLARMMVFAELLVVVPKAA